MNLPKPTPQSAPEFLENSVNNSDNKTDQLSEIILKSLRSSKPKTVKPFINYQSAKAKLSLKDLKPEVLLLREEIAQLKKDILLKDAEVEKLKLNLVDAKNNLEQFSYVASHDLKEPLRMVTSYLGLLKNKFGSQLDDKANTYIDFAIDGGAKLHTMFNGLLDLSQIGRINERRRKLPFNEIIEEVKINISKKIKNADAEIIVVGEMPVLEVYEKSVMILMENLLCNAMKFSKPGVRPIVEISAKEKETFWEFCVADNGIGIEPNCYKQIFGVFAKLHHNNVYPGNGIGLAICKKAVEHHKGAIWVTAEVDNGSRFYFTLPK